MRKTLLMFIAVFFVLGFYCTPAGATEKHKRVDKSIYQVFNEKNTNYSFTQSRSPFGSPYISPLSPGFTFGDVNIGPEIHVVTSAYDYMTNGDCRRYLQVDPAVPNNVHAIYTYADSTDATGVTSRRTLYIFSSNGGTTWGDSTLVPLIRSGFGNLELNNVGSAVIANHNTGGTVLTSYLYIDFAPGVGNFDEYRSPGPMTPIWPEVRRMSNNGFLMVSETNPTDSTFWATFQGTTFSPWHFLYYGGGASNARWVCAAGASGNLTVITNPVSNIDTLGNQKVIMFNSTDNGATFGPSSVVFRPFTTQGPNDTVAAFFGMDLVYKPGTTNWYFAVNAVNAFFKGARLYLVRKTSLTPVIIADSNNVPVWDGAFKTIAGVIGIDHPTLGWSQDGNVLYCAYSVAINDTGAHGFNTRDIFYQFSTNDGSNWSTPIRITNTPTIDEGYASVSVWNKGTTPGTYELNLEYMKDPGDGPTSFNGGGELAPPSWNQEIYRKITEATTIGVGNNGQIVGSYQLNQNYPNPFNPSTSIKFNLAKNGFVTLKVFDILGREVKTLVNSNQTAGPKEIVFDASNLPSGVYFYSLTAGDFKDTKKMILVK